MRATFLRRVLLAVVVFVLATPGSARAALLAEITQPVVGSPDYKPIQPGAPLRIIPGAAYPDAVKSTPLATCTMNFVFRDDAHTYVGTAGHCMNGAVLGQRVEAPDLGAFGTLVFHTSCPEPHECGAQPLTDDFSLIRIDADKQHLVNPAVRGYDRPPSGYSTPDDVALGDVVVVHGIGPFFAAEPGRTEYGVLESVNDLEWVAEVGAAAGFSGAPVVRRSDGLAIGVLTTNRHPSAVPDSVDQAAPIETQLLIGGPTVARIMELLHRAGFDVHLVTRAHHAKPVRTGTIAVAFRQPDLSTNPGCVGTPECALWANHCNRRLAHADGFMASIVDVRDLAGSEQESAFVVVQQPAVLNYGGVNVQFFDRACRSVELRGHDLRNVWWAFFQIPDRVAWMTVTTPCGWLCSGSSGVALRWNLYSAAHGDVG